jgi:cold-inducible RNA-binding protein
MGKRLYVGNLSYNVSEESLTQKCSEFGTVESVKIISDRDTGRSKGFGFVEMSSNSEADSVIAGLNGTNIDGRPLVVNEARPQQDRGSRAAGGRW